MTVRPLGRFWRERREVVVVGLGICFGSFGEVKHLALIIAIVDIVAAIDGY